jgi:hypothetical protein
VKRVLGGILLAIGILIAGVSGLCSGIFVISMIGSIFTYGLDPDGLMLMLLFGGLPFMAGVGLILAGHALVRSARQEDAD